MTKRQAAGATGRLVNVFWGRPSPWFTVERRSKVEGPIAHGLIYRPWKGSKISLSWLRASNGRDLHVLSLPATLCRPRGTQSQEIKVVNSWLAFR